MSVEAGSVETVDLENKLKKQTAEEKRLAVMMIPKKKKHLYKKIMYGKKRKQKEVSYFHLKQPRNSLTQLTYPLYVARKYLYALADLLMTIMSF